MSLINSPLPILDVEDIDRIFDLFWWYQNICGGTNKKIEY